MKIILTVFLFILVKLSFGQKPATGTYTYQMVLAEHRGMLGPKVKVKIKGDSIFVFAIDSMTNSPKGALLEKGIIVYHTNSKQWIIATKAEDKDATDVGGCSDGPTVIDFKKKWYWQC